MVNFLGMEFKRNELIIIGVMFLALIILGVTGKPFTIAEQTTKSTTQGDLLIQPRGTLSSVFATGSNFGGKKCFVASNRVGCISNKFEIVVGDNVVRYFDEGWGVYNSCYGWMTHHGCDPNACNYLAGAGTCTGQAANTIECHFDSQCSTGKYCDNNGECQDKRVSECEDYKARFGTYPYKCNGGTLYKCSSTGWTHIGNCYDRYNKPGCKTEGQVTTKDYELCSWECERNDECKSGYECREHICIPKTSADVVDEIDMKKVQLESEIDKCRAKGGEVVGNTCVIETPVLQELIPIDLEHVNKKVLDTPILGYVVKKTGFGIAIIIFLIIALLIVLVGYKIYKRKKR